MTDVLTVIADRLGAAGAWYVPADGSAPVTQSTKAVPLRQDSAERLAATVRQWLTDRTPSRLTTTVEDLRAEAAAIVADNGIVRGALVVAGDFTGEGPDGGQRPELVSLAAAMLGAAAESAPLMAARQELIDWATDASAASGAGRCAFAISVDGLAVANEVLGFRAGDHLLEVVVDRVIAWAGHAGRVASAGGARYIAIRTDLATSSQGLRAAELLRDLLAEPVDVDGLLISRSASIGVAADPDSSVGAEALLANAVRCGAAARAAGGDRSEVYDDDATSALLDRLRLGIELYSALAGDQLRMHYQPEFDLRTGDVRAVEALLRWQHPTLGLLRAESFVPDAEQTRTFTAVQRWVIDESCRQLAAWRAAGLAGDLLLRVNVPGNLVLEADLSATLRAALDRHGLPGNRVCVELTERRMPADLDALATELTAWRALGVVLALDDFGTGTATLTHLIALPVDVLKIDQTFISRLLSDNRAATVVAGVIALAAALELQVVAEGVDSDETVEELLRLGCTRGQGNALAEALGPERISELLDLQRNRPRR